MRDDMTLEEFTKRAALIRARHRVFKRADAYAVHVVNRRGREHGTEFVEWASEIEDGRMPAVEGE